MGPVWGGLDIELEVSKSHPREGAGQVPAGLHVRIWSLAQIWSTEKCLFGSHSAALPPPTEAALSLMPPNLPSQGSERGV